ncbi:unnamed protein product [Rotaria magnacalcarata]|uniref:G-protein coupled receptors family 1 profile domain-containing protein n=4 Tax=Rotaria magnacalcarata TaxID=392030 RepID=A0A816D5P7_9BILA|nr:unnamed protein product [Rotaria magnacalcarata]CAF2014092.1 unnamed protein product [Rotaria magnacalcarata]
MSALANLGLMIYFALVSLIGTLGNGIILLAYGNRWNSSKSTSVIFILILACVDLWTCLIVVPTIAVMEHNMFEVSTPLCRFYSFSKILIIISSFIMSFIALDRFLNIAAPHYQLLNPFRVKSLLTLFILIGIGLGVLTALAFSSAPYRESYLANYTLVSFNETEKSRYCSEEISILLDHTTNSSLYQMQSAILEIPIPSYTNITNLNLTHLSTHVRCFADTSIISETIREILRHVSNKFFFISIGIVTVFYTITFVLALQRQNPRIRALKKSLNVLTKFNSHSQISHQANTHNQQEPNDLVLPSYSKLYSSVKKKTSTSKSRHLSTDDNAEYAMSNIISNDEFIDQNVLNEPRIEFCISTSETASDDLQASTEKFSNLKQVSFQIEDNDNEIINNNNDKQQLSFRTNSFDTGLYPNTETYYTFQCPCSKARQILIKFHFAYPTFDINPRLCCSSCCLKKSPSLNEHELSMINSTEYETSSLPNTQAKHSLISNSAILRKQLHRHRLKQIRMASTFLLITVSFVLFYLPSILNAGRYIKSPLIIYYLYLCTHALNPIIYCFMNRSLRAYVFTMFRCGPRRKERNIISGATTTLER